jgi:hypothetical protein
MIGLVAIIAVLGIIISLALSVSLRGSPSMPVTRTHRGLEMKAHKGRLVYIRETQSEREI